MSALALAQDWPDAGVAFFSKKEEVRIMTHPIPGENKRSWGSSASYYPRRPIENPGQWFANHSAKLSSMLRAEGKR